MPNNNSPAMQIYSSPNEEELSVGLKEATSNKEIKKLFILLWEKGQQEGIAGKLTERVSSQIFAPFDRGSELHESFFNDEVITASFYHLSKKYSTQALKIVTISSQLGGKKSKEFIQGLTSDGKYKRSLQNLKDAELIFWPQNWGKHWYLLVIKIQKDNCGIFCLDGFNLVEAHQNMLQLGIDLITALYDDPIFPFSIEAKSLLVPRQKNDADCGPVICFYGEQICQGVPFSVYEKYASKACDYALVRVQIARWILAAPIEEQLFFRYQPPKASPSKMELDSPVKAENSPPESRSSGSASYKRDAIKTAKRRLFPS